MKIIRIGSCNDGCPSHEIDVYDVDRHYCTRKQWKEIDKWPFPDWCPLEDAPEEER